MVGVSVQKYGMGSNSMTMSALVLFIVTFEYMTQNMFRNDTGTDRVARSHS